jgi:energy-converting hydrogenase A subunit R
MHPLQLVTALEGPLALNDNALELCREFLRPEGVRFYQQVSRYCGYLADILKQPGGQSGDALKLILPFLKGHGLTNAMLSDYCRKHLRPVQGAPGAFRFLHAQGFPIFGISAGYRQFAEALGQRLGFNDKHLFCTELDLDRYQLPEAEAAELLRLEQEIASAPEIALPQDAASPQDLPDPVQTAIQVCSRTFRERLPAMDIGVIYREVKPLDGAQRAQALEESLSRTGLAMKDLIYVGDSVSDVQAFTTVRAGGGLAISFNGAPAAVKAAELMVIADNAWPIALLASVFHLWGQEGVGELAAKGTAGASRYLVLPEAVIDTLMQGLQGRNFNLYSAANPGLEKVIQESAAMRARLRGPGV